MNNFERTLEISTSCGDCVFYDRGVHDCEFDRISKFRQHGIEVKFDNVAQAHEISAFCNRKRDNIWASEQEKDIVDTVIEQSRTKLYVTVYETGDMDSKTCIKRLRDTLISINNQSFEPDVFLFATPTRVNLRAIQKTIEKYIPIDKYYVSKYVTGYDKSAMLHENMKKAKTSEFMLHIDNGQIIPDDTFTILEYAENVHMQRFLLVYEEAPYPLVVHRQAYKTIGSIEGIEEIAKAQDKEGMITTWTHLRALR